MSLANTHIGVIGLGYVGLPLAVEFSKKFPVVGFDTNVKRIQELKEGKDSSNELSREEMAEAGHIVYTETHTTILANCNVYIVTVPTPVDENNTPDLRPLVSASKMVGEVIKRGDVVIYESTVYPGTTEDECIPIIERESGLKFNEDFFAGYSPERINPGDKEHRVANILKVTSGSTETVANFVDELYKTIITAGTFKASSIKVAEASKVIENTQRDVNIGLMNELSLIFDRMDIDTEEVLKAAGTKWNFLPFRPGLVGGHCIGVDPYYLTHKAQTLGYYPEMIMASRKINDGMGFHIAHRTVKEMTKKGINPIGSKALILGFTFKENCPDLRNTRVVDIIDELQEYGMDVDVYDPWASPAEAASEYDVSLMSEPKNNDYDAIIIAVAHSEFQAMSAKRIHAFGRNDHVLFDVKYVFPANEVDARL